MSKARDIADLGSNDVLDTSSSGIDVTGSVTADGATFDGYVTINDSVDLNGTVYPNSVFMQDSRAIVFGDGADVELSWAGSYLNLNTKGNDIRIMDNLDTKVIWDASTERLGIGTATPQGQIAVSNAATTDVMEIDTAPGFSRFMSLDRTTGDEKYLQIRAKSIGFALDSGTDSIKFDSNGTVGIGNTSPFASESRSVTIGNRNIIGEVVSNQGLFGNNCYYNGVWNSPVAANWSAVRQNNGRVSIHTGINSTAGANISGDMDGVGERLRIDTGSAVFNENSGDFDFRVESDNSSHALFVQGSDGYVGIRNNTPSAHLNVGLTHSTESSIMDAGETNANILLNAPYSSNPASGSNSGAKWGIKFSGTTTGSTTSKNAAIFAVSEDFGAGYNRKVGLAFHTSPFDANYVERLRIDGDGKVGIGTDTPQSKLDVAGTISVNGNSTLQLIGMMVYRNATSYNSTTTKVWHNAFSKTFTRKKANSTIVVHCSISCGIALNDTSGAGNYGGVGCGFSINGTDIVKEINDGVWLRVDGTTGSLGTKEVEGNWEATYVVNNASGALGGANSTNTIQIMYYPFDQTGGYNRGGVNIWNGTSTITVYEFDSGTVQT
jgi:hypothetical protein